MSDIVQFPKVDRQQEQSERDWEPVATNQATFFQHSSVKAILRGVSRFVWLLTVLMWPIMKWVVTAEVTFQLFRMLYYWDTPEANAGWTFLLHFAVLTALTCYVSIYEPKGFLAAKKG